MRDDPGPATRHDRVMPREAAMNTQPSARELRAESVRLMRRAVELEIRAREMDAAQRARNHPAPACPHLKLVSEAQS